MSDVRDEIFVCIRQSNQVIIFEMRYEIYMIFAKAEIFADNYMIDARIYHRCNRCNTVYSDAFSTTLSNANERNIEDIYIRISLTD